MKLLLFSLGVIVGILLSYLWSKFTDWLIGDGFDNGFHGE